MAATATEVIEKLSAAGWNAVGRRRTETSLREMSVYITNGSSIYYMLPENVMWLRRAQNLLIWEC
ncbi:unnamed protein product [Ceratitis capitata]|uniref:(Mediterranean fruit fly) hypothetical protein n=1 Tax=Ceratitis capitata TaxID=7213 RepID=A0A811UHQ9_CERCA|nr:unnamed protein product [Ceratitis capitata]